MSRPDHSSDRHRFQGGFRWCMTPSFHPTFFRCRRGLGLLLPRARAKRKKKSGDHGKSGGRVRERGCTELRGYSWCHAIRERAKMDPAMNEAIVTSIARFAWPQARGPPTPWMAGSWTDCLRRTVLEERSSKNDSRRTQGNDVTSDATCYKLRSIYYRV